MAGSIPRVNAGVHRICSQNFRAPQFEFSVWFDRDTDSDDPPGLGIAVVQLLSIPPPSRLSAAVLRNLNRLVALGEGRHPDLKRPTGFGRVCEPLSVNGKLRLVFTKGARDQRFPFATGRRPGVDVLNVVVIYDVRDV